MLRREGAGGGYALDIGQQQAAGGQRNDPLDITQPEGWACQGGQARRYFPRHRHPKRREPQRGGGNDRQRDNPKRDRFSRQQAFAEYDERDRDDPDDENEVLHLTELPGEQESPFEKIVTPAFHAKQARQLRHRNSQAGAGLETHKNAVADQLYQHAQPQQPGEQAERCHREGSEAGNLRVTLHVPFGHCPHCPGNHERDGGSRSDRELTRGSEQGIAKTAQQVAIDADLRRQACKPRIGKGNRDRVGRQGYSGDNIGREARQRDIQPANGPEETTKAKPSFSGVPSNPPWDTASRQLV